MECQKAQQNLKVVAAQQTLLFSILTRLHAGYFGITLSLGWQALLWKSLIDIHHIPHVVHSVILIISWSFALLTLLILSIFYMSKCIFCFNTVKAEFFHRVGVNYLFAPWISWLLLLQSAPFISPCQNSYLILWWIFTGPVVMLDVKIYGQWFTTRGKRFLTAVANPSSQLSLIGTLVGARAAAEMGCLEISLGMFSLGMAHYLVLFVTLYQRVSGNERIPAALRPVLFLFVAAPSMASLAWDSIAGRFDVASKMLFFLSLFLFMALICRPALFRKSMRRFNVAWWAYSYPITLLAHASTHYAREVQGGVSHCLMLTLSASSVVVFLGLLVFTVLNVKMILTYDGTMWITNLPNQS